MENIFLPKENLENYITINLMDDLSEDWIINGSSINFKICTKSNFDLEKSGGRFISFVETGKFKNVKVSHNLNDEQIAYFTNGLKLKQWHFNKYKESNKSSYPENLYVESNDFTMAQKKLQELWIVSEQLLWARNLINTPANDCYGEVIADEIKKHNFKNCTVEILDEVQMERLNMTLALKVNAGSYKKPRVIVIKKGNPKLAIVGKGVTFDTGGVSLKPSGDMDHMIYDMSGAAAVLATAKALDSSDCEFLAIAGFVENCIGGHAQLPGDIYKSKNGKTVQVLNTDAEGRLLLGDLVYYAGELGCKDIITIATLTGAVKVALGNVHAGVMGHMSKELINAGNITGETLWEMPSDSAYDSFLNCKVADLQNISNKGAGTITGFKFIEALLKENTQLTHLDIAAVIHNGYAHQDICNSNYYTSFGVRLLTEFIKNHYIVS